MIKFLLNELQLCFLPAHPEILVSNGVENPVFTGVEISEEN